MQKAASVPLPASARRAEAELVQQGFSDLPAGLAATIITAGLLAWAVAEIHGYAGAWTWLVVMSVIVAGRSMVMVLYRRRERRGPDEYRSWRRVFIAGAAATGVTWGFGAWIFYPAMGQVGLSLLVLVIAGITAGATRSLGSVLPACIIFQLCCMAPLIVRALRGDTVIQTVIGALAILYTAFLMATAHSYHRSLSASLRLGFESAALAEELQERQRQADALNRELNAEVAHRREIEAELRTAKERAEAANQAKSEFLTTISHEIRTPMNGILGMLDLLNTASLTAAQREQVETAANSADSLLRIINDILDFSKIESGELDFESVPFRPAAVAEDILELLRPRAIPKSVTLKLEANDDSRIRVMGDPTRFRQVLLHLIGNAVKFSNHGDVEVRLAGTEFNGRVELEVSVRDHGIGMPEATCAELFLPFKQGDNSMSRRHGGTGLGLAISQKLVQGMGGRISVESKPGEGSRFAFRLILPIAKERNTATPFAVSTALPRHCDARILVVEDDAINQRVISLMLQRLGLQCRIVPDGQAALDALKAGSWDLVFMDLQLPGIDGLETTRRARLLLGDRDLPIVALTANARPEDRAACLAAGMDDFLSKPVRSEALQACLARWLRSTS